VKVIDGVEHLIRRFPGRLAVVASSRARCLGDLGPRHRDHGNARELDAAGDAVARLSPTMATGPAHGDRCGRHVIPPSALTVLLGSLFGISISELLIGGSCPAHSQRPAFVVYIVLRVKIESIARAGNNRHGVSRLGEISAPSSST